jgi:hypothetical protein
LQSVKAPPLYGSSPPGAIYSDADQESLWVWVVDDQQRQAPQPLSAAQDLGKQAFARPHDDAFVFIQDVRGAVAIHQTIETWLALYSRPLCCDLPQRVL